MKIVNTENIQGSNQSITWINTYGTVTVREKHCTRNNEKN